MIRTVRTLAVLAAALPVAAQAQQPASLWQVGPSGRDLCVLGRSDPAGRDGAVAVGLGADGRVALLVPARERVTRGRTYRLSFTLDEQRFEGGESVAVDNGLVTFFAPEFLDRFAAASRLRVRNGAGTTLNEVSLAGSADGLTRLRACVAGLGGAPARAAATQVADAAPSRPTPVAEAAGEPSPPVPIGTKAAWLADIEYPTAALRAEEQGTVRVRLSVDTGGRVSDCAVILSSGSNSLDAETCRVFSRRARYRPATDAGGRPVTGTNEQSISWRLPS